MLIYFILQLTHTLTCAQDLLTFVLKGCNVIFADIYHLVVYVL